MRPTGQWVDGLAEWTDGDTAFLSIAFSTSRLPDERQEGLRLV